LDCGGAETADGKAIPIIPNDCNQWNLK
jgi:hypothetical protein